MTQRPLLLLDVDGPLNPYAMSARKRKAGYPHHYRSFTTYPTGWPSGLRVHLRDLDGPALRALPFELVWATTWEGEANKWIGPNVGLPELPFISWKERHAEPEDGTYWKTREIVHWVGNRPFAWVDDEITEKDKEYVTAHHPGPHLLLWVDPKEGLRGEDFDILREWAASLEGGHGCCGRG